MKSTRKDEKGGNSPTWLGCNQCGFYFWSYFLKGEEEHGLPVHLFLRKKQALALARNGKKRAYANAQLRVG